MLKTFLKLLGSDAPVFRRYAWMAVALGILNGLTITALVPVVTYLLEGDLRATAMWLAVLAVGLLVCSVWRGKVEKASVQVRITVLQSSRHRLGDHIARLPVGWFTPQTPPDSTMC